MKRKPTSLAKQNRSSIQPQAYHTFSWKIEGHAENRDAGYFRSSQDQNEDYEKFGLLLQPLRALSFVGLHFHLVSLLKSSPDCQFKVPIISELKEEKCCWRLRDQACRPLINCPLGINPISTDSSAFFSSGKNCTYDKSFLKVC